MSSSRITLLAAALVLGACQGAQTPPSAAVATAGPFAASRPALTPRVASPEAGRRLYASLCASCHGDDGQAATSLGQDLAPRAADLTRCNFKYRSTSSGALPTDRDLLRVLYVGLPGTAMPSLASVLSLPAMRALALQVKARCDRFSSEKAEAPLPTPSASVKYSAASVARGRILYLQQKCASCHGDGGRGDGPAAASLKDLQGRAVLPRDHTRGAFRSGFRRVDIYRAFSTGLDGTPMPALPEAGISEAARWDLANYLVSLSHGRGRVWRFITQGPTWYEPAATWGQP